MKTQDVRSNEERTILTGMIVHNDVLATISGKLLGDRRPFESKWANTIAKWCFDYHQKYKRAPRKDIQHLFAKHAAKSNDEDAVSLIETFLERLSKDYQGMATEMNTQYVVDLASSYFDRVRLGRLAEDLQQAVENKDVEEARERLQDYAPVTFGTGDWADPFSKDEIKETFRYYDEDRSIIKFPGALDAFLTPFFERDGFISFAAPEKRGKSFWLLECVYLALRQRRKTLVYIIGDLSKNQWKRRLYSRCTRRPLTSKVIKVPRRFFVKDDKPRVKFRNKRRNKVTGRIAWEAAHTMKRLTASNQLPLKVKCVGASTISASDIERDVQQFAEEEGWVPDCIVVDYADLLDAEPGTKQMEYRHQVNESWKVMRRIALDWHLLFITATQAAASSYDARVIKKKDFSEDKRKNAHVTGMLGINQTAEEKELGVYRLNWVFLRDGKWADTQVVWTVGNLEIACPCLLSTM